MMTVEELIKHLSQFEPDTIVVAYDAAESYSILAVYGVNYNSSVEYRDYKKWTEGPAVVIMGGKW